MRKVQLLLMLWALTSRVVASKNTYRKRESLRGRQNLLRRTLEKSYEKEASPDSTGKRYRSSDDYFEVTEIKDSSDSAPKGREHSKSKSSSGGRGGTEFSQSNTSSGSRKRTNKSKKTAFLEGGQHYDEIPKDTSYDQETISDGAGSNKGHGSKLKGSWNKSDKMAKSSSAKHNSDGRGSGAKKSGGGGKTSVEKTTKKARSEPNQAKQTKLTHKPSDAESWDEEDIPPPSYDESLPPPPMDPESQDDQPATDTAAPTQPVACTLELFICPDGSSVGRTGPNCEFEPCPTGDHMTEAPTELLVPCTQEAKICPDGSFVGREGPDCEFAPCPTEATSEVPMTEAPTEPLVACTQEAKICPDGSFVGREGPDCEFAPCPTEAATDVPMTEATTEVPMTEATSEVPMTEVPTEPLVECTEEAKICPDGSFVGREGPNCEFAPCPTEATTDFPMTEATTGVPTTEVPKTQAPTSPAACTVELFICPDGSFVGRTGPDCEFEPCPATIAPSETNNTVAPSSEGSDGAIACPLDVLECPDGTFVTRIGPDCEFESCPTTTLVPTTIVPTEVVETGAPSSEGSDGAVACPLDVLECPDGSFVSRIGPDCEFELCPTTTIAPTADEASPETSAPTVMVSEATFGTSDGDDLLQMENGVCQGAIELEVGDSVTGTTAAASDEDEVEACDAGVGSLFPEVEDGLISLQQFGVWYSIEATDTKLRASVCSETVNTLAPIIVTIYAGGDGCSNLVCAPVYNTAGCSVEWAASSDFEMYYILVQSLVVEGTPLDIENDLDFELTITEAVIPTNDVCEGAIELEPGDTVPGIALSASAPSGEDISAPCSLELQPPSSNVLIPGVWYSVAGTGGRLVASTCNDSTENGPILVTIYSGACGDLQCETNTVADAPCAAEIESTVEGQTYYILVEKVLRGADAGIFELTVSG